MQLFLSHATADSELVGRIHTELTPLGTAVYLAEHDNQAGTNVHAKIVDALRASDLVIVLLTQAGFDSRYVQQEIGAALNAGKLVIPLVTGAVARAYFNLNLQFALLDIANASLVQQNTILDLTQQRATRGLENVARVKQSEGSVALTRVGVQYEEAAIKVVRAQLGALVGAGPDRGIDLQRPTLQAPRKIELPTALPADLLGRRPDIVAQRWRVESATRGISAAEAAFYPNVNLAAFAGFQAIGLGSLLKGGSGIVGAGPAVSLPIFNRRQLQGALQSQQAQYDYAVAQYNQTLIDAVNEVANLVTNWEGLVKESDEARIAEDAAQSAYSISRDRYRAGLDNYLTVLSSENQVFFTQAIRAQLLARELNLTADLVRALGGGYWADTPPGN